MPIAMNRPAQWLPFVLSLLAAALGFEYQEGWPQYCAGGIDFSSPVLVDADGDDTLEVLVASQSHLVYLWNHRGELLPGWPRPVPSCQFDETSGPACADIDLDAVLEIVHASASGQLWAWKVDGTTLPGFPVALGDNVIRLCPTLEDLNQDDTLELLAGTGNNSNRFSVFRHDGAELWHKYTAGRLHSTPATADLDHDSDIEVVVGNDGVYPQAGVYAWHHDGTGLTGWPKVCNHHVDPSPALADIDQDMDYEVFVGSLDNMLYGLSHTGADLPGWPNQCGSGLYEGIVSSPAVGDLDCDSVLDVVTGRGIIQSTSGAVYAFRVTGETLPGFPVLIPQGTVLSSPALADIDEDSDLEIIIGSTDGRLYGLHHDGSAVAGFPVEVGAPVTSSPAVADIDLDGNIEIAVGAQGDSFYVWDLPARFNPDRTPWPMFHHDPRHTGRLPARSSGIREYSGAQARARLRVCYIGRELNVFGPPLARICLTTCDPAGRKTADWQLTTDACGQASRSIAAWPSGIYFAVIKTTAQEPVATFKLAKP